MSTLNYEGLVALGKTVKNSFNKEIALRNVDAYDVQYRKSVFPTLNNWIGNVLRSKEEGLISPDEQIYLFSAMKSQNGRAIENYREQGIVPTAPVVVDQSAEIEALKAELAKVKADNQSKALFIAQIKRENELNKIRIEALTKALSKVRTVNLNGVITKIADLTGVKLG